MSHLIKPSVYEAPRRPFCQVDSFTIQHHFGSSEGDFIWILFPFEAQMARKRSFVFALDDNAPRRAREILQLAAQKMRIMAIKS